MRSRTDAARSNALTAIGEPLAMNAATDLLAPAEIEDAAHLGPGGVAFGGVTVRADEGDCGRRARAENDRGREAESAIYFAVRGAAPRAAPRAARACRGSARLGIDREPALEHARTRCGTSVFAGRSSARCSIARCSADRAPANGRLPNRHSHAATQNANWSQRASTRRRRAARAPCTPACRPPRRSGSVGVERSDASWPQWWQRREIAIAPRRGPRERRDGDAPTRARPEVADARPAVVADEHVLGLEVAMHEPRGMRGGETSPASSSIATICAPRAFCVASQSRSVSPRTYSIATYRRSSRSRPRTRSRRSGVRASPSRSLRAAADRCPSPRDAA